MAFFSKPHPTCLTKSRPLAKKYYFVYSIDLTLLDPTPALSLFFNSCEAKTKLGIITSKKIPHIYPFPSFTRAGSFNTLKFGLFHVALRQIDIGKLEQFHRLLFKKVILPDRQKMNEQMELADILLGSFSWKTTH